MGPRLRGSDRTAGDPANNAHEELTLSETIAKYGEDAVKESLRFEAWREGDLSFLLHEGQVELLEEFRATSAFISVWCIARRYGKSFAALVLACEVCLNKKKARVPYLGATITSLHDFVDDIVYFIAETAPPELKPTIVGDEIRFQNGSVIVLKGSEDLQKANRLRGPKSDLVVIDEAGFIDVLEYVVGSILVPTMMKAGRGRENSKTAGSVYGKILVASSPPESIAHPFKKFVDQAKKTKSYHHRKITDAPPSHLSEDDIAKFRSGCSSEVVWRREGLAEFITNPERALVPEFAVAHDKVVRAIPRPPFFDRYVIGDYGFTKHFTALLFAYWHFQLAKIVVEGELYLRGYRPDEIQRAVLAKEQSLWPGTTPPFSRHTRLIDAQPTLRADLSRLQAPNDPARDVRWGAVHNQEKRAALQALRMEIQRGDLLIHPDCTETIAHLENGMWNGAGTDFEESSILGHCDGVAAAMYLVRHVDRNHNPLPPTKFDFYTQQVPSHLRNPARDETEDRARKWAYALREARGVRK